MVNRILLLIISAIVLFSGDIRADDVTELPGVGNVPADSVIFNPTEPGDWSVVPQNGQEALDNLAGAIASTPVTFPFTAPGGTVSAPSYGFLETGTDDTGMWSEGAGYINFTNNGASSGFIDPIGSWNIGGPTILPNTTHRIFRDDTAGSGHLINLEIGNKNTDQGKMQFSFLNAGAAGSQNALWQFLPRKNDDSGAFTGGMMKFEKVAGENTVNFRFDLHEDATGPYPFMTIEHIAGKPVLKFNPASTFLQDFEISQGSVNNAMILSGAPQLAGASITLYGNSGGGQFKTIFTSNNVMTAQIINTGDFEFANEIHILDDDGSDYTGFKAPSTITSTGVYTLPDSFPASNMVLQSDNSGVLTWVAGSTPTGTPNRFSIFNNSGDLAASDFWNSNDTTGETTVNLTASGTNLNPISFNLNGSLSGDLRVLSQIVQTTVGNSFYFIDSAMNGNVTGNYFGVNLNNSGDVTADMGMMNLINSGDVTGATRGVYFNNSGILSSLTLFAGVNTGAVSGNSFGIDITLDGSAVDKQLLHLSNNSGAVTNWRGVEMIAAGSASSSVIGLNVNLSAITSPNQKVGLSVTDGSLQTNSNFDTSILNASPGFFSMNLIGGFYHVANGDPTTNSLIVGNNLGINFVAEDDMGPDPFLGDIGFVMNGFISQVVVADTKTVDAYNFMLAAGSVPSGVVATDGGTITDMAFFRATGLLPSGGDINVTNTYGFRVDPLLTGGGFTTNAWGVWVGDTGADNWFAKDVVIGGATGKPTGAFALDVTGAVTVAGDIASASLTPANGATGSFTTVDLKTVTVTNGIITAITP